MMKNLLEQITLLECFGFLFSVAQVFLAKNNNPKNYLFGIGGIILTLLVMFRSKLYAEFTLNLYYLVMSIYGWLYWKYGKERKEIQITSATRIDWIIAIAIVCGSFFMFFLGLRNFTDSDVPFLDAIVSAFAWAGMWLMAKRKLENWIFLNISNIISIPLMFHKQLYLYGILSIILFTVAVLGYFNWKKIMLENK